MAIEKTLVVLKPDALRRRLVTKILHYLFDEKYGFVLIAGKFIKKATMEQLDAHLPCNREWVTAMGERAIRRVPDPVPTFGTNDPYAVGTLIRNGCVDYYLSGPLLVLVLLGEDAVQTVRNMLGSALPSQAAKGTIRGDLGESEEEGAISATRNLVHASDSPDEARREIAAWFTGEEIKRIFLVV